MELLADLSIQVGGWVRSHLSAISLMMIATLLVVYGSDINRVARTAVAPFHFLVRVAAFVGLCTFGYGMVTVYLVPWLAQAMARVPTLYLPFVVLSLFILLGLVAERKKA